MTTFGRTNAQISHRWVEPLTGFDASCVDSLAPGTPVCVRGQAPFYGHLLRDRKDLLCAVFSGFEIERAQSEAHANDLTGALLVQHLSSLGRGQLDFYFVQVRRALEEFQWAGLLRAVEEAREEGLVRFLGLEVCGPVVGVLAQWRFHDAFEVVMAPRNAFCEESFRSVQAASAERRVGLVSTNSDGTEQAEAASKDHAVVFGAINASVCALWTGSRAKIGTEL